MVDEPENLEAWDGRSNVGFSLHGSGTHLSGGPKMPGGRFIFCFSLVRPVLMFVCFFFDMKIEKVFDDLFFFQMFFS